jgi:hypothetical protein
MYLRLNDSIISLHRAEFAGRETLSERQLITPDICGPWLAFSFMHTGTGKTTD